MKDETNTTHLGDGVYAHFTGYNIEIIVNDHRNEPVAYMELSAVKKLLDFTNQMINKQLKS